MSSRIGPDEWAANDPDPLRSGVHRNIRGELSVQLEPGLTYSLVALRVTGAGAPQDQQNSTNSEEATG